jgi:surfactin synthase thioesterase subunit
MALSCPVTAIGALLDPRVSVEEMLAWEHYTSVCFTAVFVPGDHFAVYGRTDVLRVLAS